ncbi:MAG: hypothetical protein FWE69_06030 [Clostridiales bacterium]|nr:hypothetical protein [Clostridiales bacterium]
MALFWDLTVRPQPVQQTLFALPDEEIAGAAEPAALSYRVLSTPQETRITQNIPYEAGGAALPYPLLWETKLRFPLTAELTFCHETGRCHFRLVNHDGVIATQEDLTEQPEPLQGFALRAHIEEDTVLQWTLAEIFRPFYPRAAPVARMDLSLESLIAHNRFQGFPAGFYDAIPFAEDSLRLDGRFADIARQMGRYDEMPLLYRALGLPDKKTIRRAFFENPALFFYAEEIKNLPFYNLDILRQILQADRVFVLLSKLHYLPGLFTFLTALARERGETAAWHALRNDIHHLHGAAGTYLLSPETQQKTLLHQPLKKIYRHNRISHNLPVRKENKAGITDCRVGEYVFVVLRSTATYSRAGNALRNCLANYALGSDDFVVAVKRNHKHCAAIALNGTEIVETSLASDESICKDKDLCAALLQWAEKWGLCLNPEWGLYNDLARLGFDVESCVKRSGVVE